MEEIDIEIWQKWKEQNKRVLKKQGINFLHSIEMSEKTLKFGNVKVNKKEFHVFK